MKLILTSIIAILLIVAGFVAGATYTVSHTPQGGWDVGATSDGSYEMPDPILGMVAGFSGPSERAGPADRVPEKAIEVYGDRIILDIKNAQWSTFTDTNSMDPVIDAGANAIQIVPKTEDEIQIGDIISYRSEYADGIIIHRVVGRGHDEQGNYFIAKGDNLPTSDPGKIRFAQIERVVVAIIY